MKRGVKNLCADGPLTSTVRILASLQSPPTQMSHKTPGPKFTQFVAVGNALSTVLTQQFRIASRPPVVEWEGRHLRKKETSVKHKPDAGVAMLGELMKSYTIMTNNTVRKRSKAYIRSEFSSGGWSRLSWCAVYLILSIQNRYITLSARHGRVIMVRTLFSLIPLVCINSAYRMRIDSSHIPPLPCLDTVVEHRSVTGELSLSYARPADNGWPLMWVNRPLQGQPTRPTQPFILSRSINE